MAIRLSGLASGLDTEAIVGALMSAQSLKKTKISNQKTKLEWKQAKWKELNDKLYKLYTDYATKMQLQSSYMTKKTSVSDPTKVSVTANTNAVNGSYTLEVNHIATSQFMTGAKLDVKDINTKLSDLDPNIVNKEIKITNGDKTSYLTITSDMTIADFTSQLQGMGLNASFDTKQQRFFISSKESGKDAAFTFTTSALSASEITARENLRNALHYDRLSSDKKAIVDSAMATLRDAGADPTAINAAVDTIAQAAYENNNTVAKEEATKYISAKLYTEKYAGFETTAKDELKSQYYEDDGSVKTSIADSHRNDWNTMVETDKQAVYAEAGVSSMTEDEYVEWATKRAFDKAVASKADSDTASEVSNLISNDANTKLAIETAASQGFTKSDLDAVASNKAQLKYYNGGDDTKPVEVRAFEGTSSYTLDKVKNDIRTSVDAYANVTDRNDAITTSALTALGLDDIEQKADGTYALRGTGSSDIGFIAGSDSEVYLNGAKMTSSTSTVSANGLNIELTGTTKPGEAITFSVSTDVDSVYNKVKDFLKEYNAIMKEMNTLYSAKSARGYEPLTKEEKEAMTDDDIKLWEDKIKDSLLRGDTTLNSIMSGMRSAMQTQVEYDGKKYSLASFGIMTSYDYTEGGQYHIYGDPDDSVYGDRADKLKAALMEDPDAVVNVLSNIFGKLRETMSDKMAGSKVSSALTFYNDKQIQSDLDDYEEDLKKWEDKLAEMEDAYYKKFTAMEVALAKLQSQQSSLAGLFGGN